MNIGFSGCSFTSGAEMLDPIKDRYSAVIARELNINEYNVSKNGNSIDIICKSMYDLTKKIKLDFAVIQITAFSRISYAYENEIRNFILYQKNFQSNQVRDFHLYLYSAKTDYKLWYDLQKWKIFAIHEYMNSLKIPHIFLFMGLDEMELFKDDPDVPETLIWHKTALRKFCKENNYPIGENLHPLELGHEMIAKKIVIPYIKEMCDVV